MKKTITFILLSLYLGCSKSEIKKDLELAFLNKTVITYSKNSDKDSINIIKYSIKNNSDKIYFINNSSVTEELSKAAIYNNGINLLIYDSNDLEVKYAMKKRHNYDSIKVNCISSMFDKFISNKVKLGYKLKHFGLYDRKNIFFIHPNETIFFAYTLNLSNPTSSDEIRYGFADLDNRFSYYSKLSIASDSSNYKNALPKDVLETIKVNNVKVYHGIIESKNTVPIKVLE